MQEQYLINLDEYKGHPKFEVYYPDGKLIYSGNDILKFHWIRTQIKKYGIYRCYVKYNDDIISIDKYGNLDHYPDGFDELISDIFLQLV